MPYANDYLRDFAPVWRGILQTKGIRANRLRLEALDEESERHGRFEPTNIRDVLEQVAGELNFLTVYTDRAVYFQEFAEKMYQENGLPVMLSPKKDFYRGMRGGRKTEGKVRGQGGETGVCRTLVLDFEWEGKCHFDCMTQERYYIPIHKKRWLPVDNLDIMIPFGYNTLIVRDIQRQKKRLARDRFETAFYNEKD